MYKQFESLIFQACNPIQKSSVNILLYLPRHFTWQSIYPCKWSSIKSLSNSKQVIGTSTNFPKFVSTYNIKCNSVFYNVIL